MQLGGGGEGRDRGGEEGLMGGGGGVVVAPLGPLVGKVPAIITCGCCLASCLSLSFSLSLSLFSSRCFVLINKVLATTRVCWAVGWRPFHSMSLFCWTRSARDA